MNDLLALCPHCGKGKLVQLADADRDVAWCPVCRAVTPDCVAGRETIAPDEELPEALYQTVLAAVPVVTVDIALCCNGTVLLVKRGRDPAKNCWWTPGGRIRRGETIVAAAIRKLAEEVGIPITAKNVLGRLAVVEMLWPERHNITIVVSAAWFGATMPVPRLDRNHTDHRWLPTDHAEELHPTVQKMLRASTWGAL